MISSLVSTFFHWISKPNFYSFYNDLLHLSCNVGQRRIIYIPRAVSSSGGSALRNVSVNMLNSFFSEFVGSFVTYYE
jgi:hypothetical protein